MIVGLVQVTADDRVVRQRTSLERPGLDGGRAGGPVPLSRLIAIAVARLYPLLLHAAIGFYLAQLPVARRRCSVTWQAHIFI